MPPARFLDAVIRRSRKEDKKSLLTAEDSDLTDVEHGRGDSTSDVDGSAVQSGVLGHQEIIPATDPLGRAEPTVDVAISDDDAPDM